MQNRTPITFPRISRTIDEIRESLFARIEAVQDELAAAGFLPRRLNLNKGIARGLIELTAWGIWQVYNLLEILVKQAVPATATGIWLNLHLAAVGLFRKMWTKATGRVRFFRDGNIAGNIVIPSGRIVRTLPDGAGEIYRFVTTEAAVLLADEDFVDVPVTAEEYGTGSNAGPGQICELVTPVIGVRGVTNVSGWLVSEGADKETDDQARERYQLRWMGLNGCTKYAYKAWALSVTGCVSVEILDQHPRGQGTVGVVVRGSAGLPTEALLKRVEEAIAEQAPINDDWFVISPDAVPVAVSGRLHFVNGDPELLKHEALQRVYSLFAETSKHSDITPVKIGQDVPLDLLTKVAMGVSGVKSVNWNSPSEDLVVPKSGLAILAEASFTTCQEAEE
ncbi:baseplate J/gp47 family protein [Oleidesulfovibrio sp.]|uniref:baseplate J/gp47 family protein n=1 Tax=Oleidesulfovibrio sp. TaxID=2909707 RepID=UPI003A8398E7